MIRDSALFLPILVGVGACLHGWLGALGVAVAGVVALGSLWVLVRLVTRLSADQAAGRPAVVPALLLAAKFALALPIYAGLMFAFGAVEVALGISTVVLGLTVGGLVRQVAAPIDPPEAGLPALGTNGADRAVES